MISVKFIDWDIMNRKSLIRNFPKIKSVKAFIQARVGSSRLPNKIYEDINGAPMLWHTVSKAKQCKLLDDVIIISPGILPELPENIKGFSYSGGEDDVLGRYAAALEKYPCDYVVRLTSDCPLLDPYLIDCVIKYSMEFDYGTNVLPCTFPDGMDVEVISSKTLNLLNEMVEKPFDREHVTTHIRNNASVQSDMNIMSVQSPRDMSYIKLSVDTIEDLKYVRMMEKNLCAR